MQCLKFLLMFLRPGQPTHVPDDLKIDNATVVQLTTKHLQPQVTFLYSDCLRRESNFLASTHLVTALCVCVCCIVCVCDCVMVIREPTHK